MNRDKKNFLKVNEVDADTYNQNLDSYKYSLFNTTEWVLSTKNESNKALFLEIRQGDEIIGKICGIDFQPKGMKERMLYFYAGPALKEWNEDVFRNCLEALRLFTISRGYLRIMIRPFDQLIEKPVKVKGYFYTRNTEMVILFKEQAGSVHFSYGFKQNKKKALKAGAVYKTSRSPELVPHIIRLMGNTLNKRDKKYGVRYNPYYIMNLTDETLYKLLDVGLGVFHYVEVNNEIHCVQLNLEKGGRIYGLLMGSDDFAYSIGIPSLIDYMVITDAIGRGMFSYNLGSLPKDYEGGLGIRKYKESAGARARVENGYYSYFLLWPKKLLNPLIRISKSLPNNRLLDEIRKILSRLSIGGSS